MPSAFLRSARNDQATINALTAQVSNPFYGLAPVYPKTIAVADLLRPYQEFGDITETQPVGFSWYHALQIRAERRFADGLSFGMSYTWAKYMEATSFLNSGDPRPTRSISSLDRPHRLNINAIYELPFGRAKSITPGLR